MTSESVTVDEIAAGGHGGWDCHWKGIVEEIETKGMGAS